MYVLTKNSKQGVLAKLPVATKIFICIYCPLQLLYTSILNSTSLQTNLHVDSEHKISCPLP